MRIAIFTETFIHKNTAAANQAAVLQKGLQQLGHKVLIVTGSTKATESRSQKLNSKIKRHQQSNLLQRNVIRTLKGQK